MRTLYIPNKDEVARDDYDLWFADGNHITWRDPTLPGCLVGGGGIGLVADHNAVVERLRARIAALEARLAAADRLIEEVDAYVHYPFTGVEMRDIGASLKAYRATKEPTE